MKSDLPKLLHKVGGLPIIGHVVGAVRNAGASEIAVVTGPGHEGIRAAVRANAPDVEFFEQTERRGTAHAASMAREAFEQAQGTIVVVYGDHPLLRPENFAAVLERLEGAMDAAILGFRPQDPTGYGRFITDGDRLLDIREHKDASEEERRIGLCNACILAFRAPVFKALIDKVGRDNAQGEYYLTDLVKLANKAGYRVGYAVAPEEDVMGVNSRAQLAQAEALFQARMRARMLDNGVTLIDPGSVHFSYDTEIGRDVVIEPNVVFGPGVVIASNATIHAFSHIEGALVGEGASVGPFARLRPDAVLAAGAKVGNFVEIKKANVGAGAKVNHLSYIGDAEIGAAANIGAGTITCNYDGINKHRTMIGEGAFIGSNSALVAPVEIGDGAYVASGSVITENVPPEAMAVARGRQVNKPGHAETIRKRARDLKNRKQGS